VSKYFTQGYYALKKCHRRDLSLRPTDPEADTLTTQPPRPQRSVDCSTSKAHHGLPPFSEAAPTY